MTSPGSKETIAWLQKQLAKINCDRERVQNKLAEASAMQGTESVSKLTDDLCEIASQIRSIEKEITKQGRFK